MVLANMGSEIRYKDGCFKVDYKPDIYSEGVLRTIYILFVQI